MNHHSIENLIVKINLGWELVKSNQNNTEEILNAVILASKELQDQLVSNIKGSEE